jgi:hypothetical protein
MDYLRFRARRPGFGFGDTLFANPFVVAIAAIGLAWFAYDWVSRNRWVLERLPFGFREGGWDDQVVYGGMHAPASRSASSRFDEVRDTARRIADQVGTKVDDVGDAAEQAWGKARERADELSDQAGEVFRSQRARRFMPDQGDSLG